MKLAWHSKQRSKIESVTLGESCHSFTKASFKSEHERLELIINLEKVGADNKSRIVYHRCLGVKTNVDKLFVREQ